MKKKTAVSAVKRQVRIGIVGSKFAAGFHADSYRRNEHAELCAVAAIDNLPEFSSQWKIPDTSTKTTRRCSSATTLT